MWFMASFQEGNVGTIGDADLPIRCNQANNPEETVVGSETPRGKIVVISAPSGAGKTTLLNYIRQQIPNVTYSVSATTRPPRSHEIDGVHYHFYSVDQFKTLIGRDEFAEWQIVHDNYYGTPRSNIEQVVTGGNHVIMDIDVYGKKKLDRIYPDSVGILILPPSLAVLERRLRMRGTESEPTIRTRMKNASDEMTFAREQGIYAYTIINDTLERAQTEFLAIMNKIIAL
jgi:guanylate kinase